MFTFSYHQLLDEHGRFLDDVMNPLRDISRLLQNRHDFFAQRRDVYLQLDLLGSEEEVHQHVLFA